MVPAGCPQRALCCIWSCRVGLQTAAMLAMHHWSAGVLLHAQALSDTLVFCGWQAKTQAECYDYLFDAAIRMRQLGCDASKPPTLKRGAAQINGHDNHGHGTPSEHLLPGSLWQGHVSEMYMRQSLCALPCDLHVSPHSMARLCTPAGLWQACLH